ncbi:hypothetical protein FFI94_016530 [Rhodococcus sp. KBS0724]|uniref:hypothetical protein n=1 Tax=Rhodococcus sp. KBS0724 TaxID=1179674 RepID=UPI00110F008C|nr:hypothetical protein [Rhodococcus sp. KBS0724]TSD47581.1 hypothetical protein FFI94_016530 [Rhodococcus sp. KBS0724]
MKKTIATIMIVGAVSTVCACGSDDDAQNQDNGRASQVTMKMPAGTSTGDMSAVDRGKLTAFVVAFRTRYPDLSRDRDDQDIKEIVLDTCDDIADGDTRQQVSDEIRDQAEHNGLVPTQAQIDEIYDMVIPACP